MIVKKNDLNSLQNPSLTRLDNFYGSLVSDLEGLIKSKSGFI